MGPRSPRGGELIVSDFACLGLLGGFDCTVGDQRYSLPLGTQRLLALLALQEGGTHRSTAAELLWPDSSVARAAGNLRSALWRGRQLGDVPLVENVGPRLRLTRDVHVDVRRTHTGVARALRGESTPDDPHFGALVVALSLELLPSWCDEWLLLERERWDQVRVHALEGIAELLLAEARYLEAMQTALAAVAVEPIRETAHRIVIEVHLAEGNAASALRHYHKYRTQLHRELGVAPSARLARLASTLLPS